MRQTQLTQSPRSVDSVPSDLGSLDCLVGLCFFVVAHVKKRNDLNGAQDASESEERQTQSLEPIQVTVGGSLSLLCLFISLAAASRLLLGLA